MKLSLTLALVAITIAVVAQKKTSTPAVYYPEAGNWAMKKSG